MVQLVLSKVWSLPNLNLKNWTIRWRESGFFSFFFVSFLLVNKRVSKLGKGEEGVGGLGADWLRPTSLEYWRMWQKAEEQKLSTVLGQVHVRDVTEKALQGRWSYMYVIVFSLSLSTYLKSSASRRKNWTYWSLWWSPKGNASLERPGWEVRQEES